MNVFYKKGDAHILDTVKEVNGELFSSINRIPAKQFVSENNCEIMEFDEACDEIFKINKCQYCKEWASISKDEYFEALECLPPEKWQKINEFSIFRMSEYTTGQITCHYVRYKDQFFSANRSIAMNYVEMIEEMKHLIK